MTDLSAVLLVIAIVIGNAGLYLILISACKRQGVSVFTIFRPIEDMRILQLEDGKKLLLLTIIVGLLLFVSFSMEKVNWPKIVDTSTS